MKKNHQKRNADFSFHDITFCSWIHVRSLGRQNMKSEVLGFTSKIFAECIEVSLSLDTWE